MTTDQKQYTPTPGIEVCMKMSPLETGKLWQKALFLEKERDTLAAKVKELEKKLDDQGFEYADKIQILEDKLNYCLARARNVRENLEYSQTMVAYSLINDLITKIEAERSAVTAEKAQ